MYGHSNSKSLNAFRTNNTRICGLRAVRFGEYKTSCKRDQFSKNVCIAAKFAAFMLLAEG